MIKENENGDWCTAFPSGKHLQKKFGRGRPTASLIASVITPVARRENSSPDLAQQCNDTMSYWHLNFISPELSIKRKMSSNYNRPIIKEIAKYDCICTMVLIKQLIIMGFSYESHYN